MVALQLADDVRGELICERSGGDVIVRGVVRSAAGRAPGRIDWPIGKLPDGWRPPYRITSPSIASRDGQPHPCIADFKPDGQINVCVPFANADSVHLMARIWLHA